MPLALGDTIQNTQPINTQQLCLHSKGQYTQCQGTKYGESMNRENCEWQSMKQGSNGLYTKCTSNHIDCTSTWTCSLPVDDYCNESIGRCEHGWPNIVHDLTTKILVLIKYKRTDSPLYILTEIMIQIMNNWKSYGSSRFGMTQSDQVGYILTILHEKYQSFDEKYNSARVYTDDGVRTDIDKEICIYLNDIKNKYSNTDSPEYVKQVTQVSLFGAYIHVIKEICLLDQFVKNQNAELAKLENLHNKYRNEAMSDIKEKVETMVKKMNDENLFIDRFKFYLLKCFDNPMTDLLIVDFKNSKTEYVKIMKEHIRNTNNNLKSLNLMFDYTDQIRIPIVIFLTTAFLSYIGKLRWNPPKEAYNRVMYKSRNPPKEAYNRIKDY